MFFLKIPLTNGQYTIFNVNLLANIEQTPSGALVYLVLANSGNFHILETPLSADEVIEKLMSVIEKAGARSQLLSH